MTPRAPLLGLARWIYELIQWVLEIVFSQPAPLDSPVLDRPKIAIIGAGVTGVTAAAHCAEHGIDVQIFEAASREGLGGVWSVCNPFDYLSDSMNTRLMGP